MGTSIRSRNGTGTLVPVEGTAVPLSRASPACLYKIRHLTEALKSFFQILL